MTDYSFTKHRIFQWMGILLALGIIAVGYWYYQSQASTLNKSPTGSLTSGLVGYWTFDGADTSSTTATDRGSGGNNGTLTNGPTVTQGKVGQALDFDGSDDYVTITDADDTKYTGTLTLCTWAKIDTGGAYRHFMGKHTGNGGTQNPFDFRTSNDTTPRLNLIRANTDSRTWSGPAVTLGQWKHYCVVAPSTIETAPTFYIDGAAAVTPASVGSTGTGAPTGSGAAIRIGVRADDAVKMDGSMDEVRIYNRMLSAAEIASLYALGQSDKTNSSVSQPGGTGRLDAGLAGYWKLDDGSGTSATDSSVNGVSGTLTNMEDPGDWTTGQIEGALDFDGSDEYVELGSSVRINNSDRGVFSTWVKIDTDAGTNKYLFGYGGAAAASAAQFSIYVDGTANTIDITQCSTNGGTYNTVKGSTGLTTATWYHVAVVSDGSTWAIYVNGNVEALTVTQGSNNGNWLGDTSPSGTVHSTLATAYYNGGYSGYIDAKLDEIRLYNRAVSPEEVSQLYRLTSPTAVDTGLMAYWSFNDQDMSGGTVYDRSGRPGNSGTAVNTTKIEGRVGQALSFNGSTSVVNISSPSGSLSTPTYATFSAWINTSGDPGHAQYIFRERNANTYSLYLAQTTRNLVFANISGTRDSGYAIPANIWALVTLTVNNGTGTFYVNGVQVNQQSFSISGNSSAYVCLGSYDDGPQFVFNGKLDEIRIYSRALSAPEIKSLYDAGQSDKVNSSVSQPQGIGRLDSGLAGYWPLDEGTGTTTADGSVNANNGTLTNGPTWTTGQIGSAVDFDGSDDYIAVTDPASGVLDFNVPGNGVYGRVFSIAGWFNRDTFTTDDTIIAKKNDQGNTTAGYVVYIDDADDKLYVVVCGAACAGATSPVSAVSTTTYTATGWHHFVITVDQYRNTGGGDSRCPSIWVDGTPVTTNSCGEYLHYTGNLANSLALTIGAESDGGNPFDGKLDDIRIYNRPVSPGYIRDLYQNANPTVANDSSLKGYWSFDGAAITGTIAHDVSGFGNDGTLTSGPAITEGKLSQGISLDGVNDTVSGSLANVPMGNTIALWAKYVSGFGVLFSHDSGSNNGQRLSMGGSLTFTLGGVADYDCTGISGLSSNVWYFVAVTTTGNGGTMTCYAGGPNGTLTATSAIAIGTRSGTPNAFRMGNYPTGSAYFNGSIDEVRIYNRALGASEIAALYNAGR